MEDVRLIHGDSQAVLPTLETASVDSLVTDPPAGINFMAKEFDSDRGGRILWIEWLCGIMRECFRILKPGCYGLVWAIPRTSHWTATALEDAGFEIRDRIAHLFGQGFPKGKTCLKPACEDWWLVRKPGGGKMKPLGIEECRIEHNEVCKMMKAQTDKEVMTGGGKFAQAGRHKDVLELKPNGRWPANVCLDEEAARLLDEQTGPSSVTGKRSERSRNAVVEGTTWGANNHRSTEYTDSGNVSRFFYCAKASRSDRGESNTHPTVKSTALMSWLVKLVTVPGGLCLDPFAGSGTTGVACLQTGRKFIGIEIDPQYHAIAEKRIAEARAAHPLFDGVA